MANLHLVTGFAGQEHVTAADQGAFHVTTMGSGQHVINTGNLFAASIVTNNQVKVLDGEIYMHGRYIRLEPNTYVELNIENGTQGYKRNDLIVARYTKTVSTGVEEVNLVVIKGEPSENPVDPEYVTGNILEGALQNDLPLFRITIDGLTATGVECLFTAKDFSLERKQEATNLLAEESTLSDADHIPFYDASAKAHRKATWKKVKSDIISTKHNHSANDINSGILPIERGGTGVATLSALKSLSASEKVGDIKTTVRTDLGENWLLCNGDPIPDDCKELLELRPVDLTNSLNWRGFGKDAKGTYTNLEKVIFVNGVYYYAIRENDSTVGAYRTHVYASRDLENWSYTTIETAGDTYYCQEIKYLNGQFVLLYVPFSSKMTIFVADTLDGEWSKIDITPTSVLNNMDNYARITYGNGYYYLTAGGSLFRATALDGTWSNIANFDIVNTMRSYKLDFYDGYVFGDFQKEGSYGYWLFCYDTTTEKCAYEFVQSNGKYGNITYSKELGKVVLACYPNYSSSGTKYASYFNRETGKFVSFGLTDLPSCTDIAVVNGRIILRRTNQWYVYDIGTKAQLANYTVVSNSNNRVSEDIRRNYNECAFLSNSQMDSGYINTPAAKLPIVAFDDAYAYIKVKE